MSGGFGVMAEALRKAGFSVGRESGVLVARKDRAVVVVDEAPKREKLEPEDIVANVEATHGKVGARAIARNVARARAERKARR